MKMIYRVNPRRFFSDFLPIKFKIFWKSRIAPLLGRAYYHEIIPETKLHHAWYLGAQPTANLIRQFLRCTNGGQQRVHIISMLADHEWVIKNDLLPSLPGLTGQSSHCDDVIFHRCSWYDHGHIDATVGRNQSVSDFVEFQRTLYPLFAKKKTNSGSTAKVFYCHCMAGRSRSLVETIAFLYFYPRKDELFDFENWPTKAMPTKDLQRRLKNQPTFSDLAEFIKSRRRQVRDLINLDGDQLGLLGLLALHSYAHETVRRRKYNINELLALAQDMGFMLKAPLDYAFRSELDRQVQENDLHFVYGKFFKQGVDLLAAMVGLSSVSVTSNSMEASFIHKFSQLSPREQACFAVLMQVLVNRGESLIPLAHRDALYYAKVATQRPKKLAAGDQVELLRIFGRSVIPPLNCATIVRRITKGNRLDRYNGDIQLAELTSVLLHRL